MSGVRDGAGRRMFGHPSNQRPEPAESAPASTGLYPSHGDLTSKEISALLKQAREDIAPLHVIGLSAHEFSELEKLAERLAKPARSINPCRDLPAPRVLPLATRTGKKRGGPGPLLLAWRTHTPSLGASTHAI